MNNQYTFFCPLCGKRFSVTRKNKYSFSVDCECGNWFAYEPGMNRSVKLISSSPSFKFLSLGKMESNKWFLTLYKKTGNEITLFIFDDKFDIPNFHNNSITRSLNHGGI